MRSYPAPCTIMQRLSPASQSFETRAAALRKDSAFSVSSWFFCVNALPPNFRMQSTAAAMAPTLARLHFNRLSSLLTSHPGDFTEAISG
ncbi:hypothetical protein L345_00896, partial [Ophiophagus hannah]